MGPKHEKLNLDLKLQRTSKRLSRLRREASTHDRIQRHSVGMLAVSLECLSFDRGEEDGA